jgi:hypothetical protein
MRVSSDAGLAVITRLNDAARMLITFTLPRRPLHHCALFTKGSLMVRNTRTFAEALSRWAGTLRGAIRAMLRRRESVALLPAPVPDKPVEQDQAQGKAVPVRKRKTSPRKPKASPTPAPLEPATPNCPHCRKPMVIKTARTGRNAGDFWGCADYPKCRGIRPIFRAPSAPAKKTP